MTRPARAPTATLFGQLLALIVLSLVAAQGISAFIVFQLPPPTPDFYRLSEIAQTFGPNPPSFTERRALKVVNRAEPPSPPLRGRYVPAIKANLAEALGVSEDDIKIGAEYRPPWTDRRTLRTIRARIIREGGGREEHFLIAPFEVGVRQADGSWRVVQPEPPGFFSP
ncbi:MAG TPA: two-component sensor histidine kinase, partial [Phenylobacterium sp.]|nr:two-component sensor histidine kinase [Phenylobacterium sp.]